MAAIVILRSAYVLLSDFLFLVNIPLYYFRLLYSIYKELPSLFLTIAYNPPYQTAEVLTDGLQDIKEIKNWGKFSCIGFLLVEITGKLVSLTSSRFS